MTEEELERSRLERHPPRLEQARHALLSGALRKQVRLRLDLDLLAWLKRQGPAARPASNVALRAFDEAHERRRAAPSISCVTPGCCPPGFHAPF